MPHEITDYLIGERGVQLVPSPIHTPDGGILVAKNVEFIRDSGIGGNGTSGGLAKLTGQTALGGSILQLGNVPLAYPGEFDLMVGLSSSETNAWKKSIDGAAFTDIASATLQRLGVQYSSLWGSATIPASQRSASYRGRFYFAGDNYTESTDAPVLVTFDGTSQSQLSLPSNPTATNVPRWISDVYIYNGLIYLAIYDPGGVAPDHKGRVVAFDPSNGTLYEVGNRFGNGSGENTKGFPFCLVAYGGYLFAGTYGVSGNNLGGLYKIRVGVDESWTLDTAGTLHNGYYMSLCAYKGSLYMGTDADSSGTAIIQKRTSTGTVSTSLSAPAGNTAFFTGLTVFNDLLFAGYYNPNTPKTLIKVFDGSSWTTDKDISVDIGATYTPGKPFVFRSNLYWPIFHGLNGDDNLGVLLKRTTAGVWSSVITNVGLRGGLGQFAFTS